MLKIEKNIIFSVFLLQWAFILNIYSSEKGFFVEKKEDKNILNVFLNDIEKGSPSGLYILGYPLSNLKMKFIDAKQLCKYINNLTGVEKDKFYITNRFYFFHIKGDSHKSGKENVNGNYAIYNISKKNVCTDKLDDYYFFRITKKAY
jgi:hypothetical protein